MNEVKSKSRPKRVLQVPARFATASAAPAIATTATIAKRSRKREDETKRVLWHKGCHLRACPSSANVTELPQRTGSGSARRLDDLPQDLLMSIASFLAQLDHNYLALVSKRCHLAARAPASWTHVTLYLTDYPHHLEFARCRTLHLDMTMQLQPSAKPLERLFQHVQCLTLTDVGSTLAAELCQYAAPVLHTLHVDRCIMAVWKTAWVKWLMECPRLTALDWTTTASQARLVQWADMAKLPFRHVSIEMDAKDQDALSAMFPMLDHLSTAPTLRSLQLQGPPYLPQYLPKTWMVQTVLRLATCKTLTRLSLLHMGPCADHDGIFRAVAHLPLTELVLDLGHHGLRLRHVDVLQRAKWQLQRLELRFDAAEPSASRWSAVWPTLGHVKHLVLVNASPLLWKSLQEAAAATFLEHVETLHCEMTLNPHTVSTVVPTVFNDVCETVERMLNVRDVFVSTTHQAGRVCEVTRLLAAAYWLPRLRSLHMITDAPLHDDRLQAQLKDYVKKHVSCLVRRRSIV